MNNYEPKYREDFMDRLAALIELIDEVEGELYPEFRFAYETEKDVDYFREDDGWDLIEWDECEDLEDVYNAAKYELSEYSKICDINDVMEERERYHAHLYE